MKNSIIFVSAFSVVSIMMVSCASGPQTTTTTPHQTTVTTESSARTTQPGGSVTGTTTSGEGLGARHFDRRILGTAVVWRAYPRRRMQSAMPGIAAPSGLVIFGIGDYHWMPLPGAAPKPGGLWLDRRTTPNAFARTGSLTMTFCAPN